MSADIESSTDSGSIKHDHANSPSYPHDRIGLFISSSMRDEEDFSWSSYRDELDKLLRQSPLYNPFEIERHASIKC